MKKDYYVPQSEEMLLQMEGNVLVGISEGGEDPEPGGPDAPMRRFTPGH